MIYDITTYVEQMLEAFPNQSSTILRICIEGLAFSNINNLKKSLLNELNGILSNKKYLEVALITVRKI
jgi:hypothetical protein